MGATQSILVVDPDSDFLDWAREFLAAPAIKVETCTTAEQALRLFASLKPDLVIAEVRITPFSGMQLLQRIRQTDPNAMVILAAGFPSTTMIIEAMKYGAYEFLRKERLNFELRPVVEDALKTKDALDCATRESGDAPAFSGEVLKEHIIGESPAMQDVFKMIGRVSRSHAPVLITGESGSGKEVVAKAVHRFSPRAANDFVAINCAAIPPNLLESELFGHEKGAFTGAMQRRLGRFEQCANGTLFLDEIGDMPMELQSKILRVLQDGSFSRVGGNDSLSTNTRILAATNKNLENAVAKGSFREDLFYRLNVLRIHLPPLRQRREDVLLLARFFLHRITGSAGQFRLSSEASQLLVEHDWPGNVRELENTIQRAVALATTNVLLPRDLPLGQVHWEETPNELAEEEVAEPAEEPAKNVATNIDHAVELLFRAAESDPNWELLPWLEREMTSRAMQRTDFNQVRAAKLLGITRATLRKRLERFGIPKGKG